MIRTPYLLFLGDAHDQLAAKVAQGIKDWRPDNVVGQFRLEGCDADVGVEDLSLEEAYARGARTLVVGVANRGGVISEAWLSVLAEAMEIGFDIASGLHNLLHILGNQLITPTGRHPLIYTQTAIHGDLHRLDQLTQSGLT